MALQSLLSNRARFTEYSAAIREAPNDVDELTRMIFFFKNQAVLAMDRAKRVHPPVFAKVWRPGD